MVERGPARSGRPRARRLRARALLCAATIGASALLVQSCGSSSAPSNDARTPEQVVDGFYTALAARNAALALSLLASDVVVFEMGTVDRSRRDYAAVHLPTDMDIASRTGRELLSRQSGAVGDARWVASQYRETPSGEAPSGAPEARSTTLSETIILRRAGDSWQIAHLHWSTPTTASVPVPAPAASAAARQAPATAAR